LDWPGADEIAEVLTENPITPQQVQQEVQKAVGEALQNQGDQIKKFDAMTKRIKTIADIYTDDDKIEVELLKLLDANGISDEEIRGRALEIVNQMKEQQLLTEQSQEQPQQTQ
jgi:hypothetical protein